MADETETIRRAQQALVNGNAGPREALEVQHGRVWDTSEMQQDFEVVGFMAPYIVVTERKTGTKGSLMFQHSPRFYFGWRAYDKEGS